MQRLFVALPMPDDICAELARLCFGVPGAKWSRPENFHVTLRFVGEVDNAEADDIAENLGAIEADPFALTLAGIGHFETGDMPRALWVGVERNAALMALQTRIEVALQRCGLPPERRKFKPHVNLARLKGPELGRLQSFIAEHNLFRLPPFAVESFTLFSSHRSQSGAIYTPEAIYPLGRGIAGPVRDDGAGDVEVD